jgi:predicted AlkP superfamily pyrophosphatase or phosphodiesterase
MTRWRILCGAMTLALTGAGSAAPDPGHVVMISIDGLMPSIYTAPGPAAVPTLRRLASEGAFAEGVVGVMPTVTYPSHTTLITGLLPADHGIVSNNILDPERRSNDAWYWYARDIVAPTLPGVLRARGLSAAAVSWPVTVGMDVDYLFPEFFRSRHPESLSLLRALSTPRLIDAFDASGKGPFGWPPTDRDRTELAAFIIRTWRPHLTLLHIFESDSAQHDHGPGSAQALAAIERADAHVATILAAIDAAGLRDRTDVVVVSDHGFMSLERRLQLNALFKKEGLLSVDDRGAVTAWQAYFQSSGGSGFVHLRNPADTALTSRVQALLAAVAADPANGVDTVLDREDLSKLGADPRASFAVSMKPGFYTSEGHSELLGPTPGKGGHGFAPTRPEMRASLIAAGPHSKGRGALGLVRMTQIAPTIARWFGVTLSPNADRPLDLN